MPEEMMISADELQPGDFWTFSGKSGSEVHIVHSIRAIDSDFTMVRYISGNQEEGFRIREMPLKNGIKFIAHRTIWQTKPSTP